MSWFWSRSERNTFFGVEYCGKKQIESGLASSFIDNDIHHHSGQNVVDSFWPTFWRGQHLSGQLNSERSTFWPLWWWMNHFRFVNREGKVHNCILTSSFKPKFGNVTSLSWSVPQKYEIKCVPHVQHDYSSSFNQWYCFVGLRSLRHQEDSPFQRVILDFRNLLTVWWRLWLHIGGEYPGGGMTGYCFVVVTVAVRVVVF